MYAELVNKKKDTSEMVDLDFDYIPSYDSIILNFGNKSLEIDYDDFKQIYKCVKEVRNDFDV